MQKKVQLFGTTVSHVETENCYADLLIIVSWLVNKLTTDHLLVFIAFILYNYDAKIFYVIFVIIVSNILMNNDIIVVSKSL